MSTWAHEFLRLLATVAVLAAAGALLVAIVMRAGEAGITAYATVFLALVTTALAAYTSLLASETRAASRLADRHHQESLNPIITAESANGSIFREFNRRTHRFNAKIRNVGNGPALRVQFRTTISPQQSVGDIVWPEVDNVWEVVGTVAAGETTMLYSSVPSEKFSVVPDQRTVHFSMNVRYANAFGGDGTLTIIHTDAGAMGSLEEQPRAVSRALPQ